MGPVGYAARRVLQYGVILLAALTLNFTLPRLAPGDPLFYLFGREVDQLTAEQRRQVLSQFGLDRPLLEQYGRYLAGIISADLGTSVRFGRPVSALLAERIPWTVTLVGSAILLSAVVGTAAGALAARRRGEGQDVGSMACVLLLNSMPPFWVGMILLGVFAVELRWLPSFGAVPPAAAGGGLLFAVEVGRRMILPLATLTLAYVGGVFLIARSSMLMALGGDYVRTVRAKGVSEGRVVFRHALRNALLPVYTNVTLSLGHLLGGATVVETVFSYPGLGRLIYEGVLARDYPLLQGALLLVALGVVIANFLADLGYPLIDPRVRRDGTPE